MAGRKETISQVDFSFGAVRPEAVERDDTEVLERSLKEAENTLTLTTGQAEVRPGTVFTDTTTGTQGFEVNLGRGRVYDLTITSTGYEIRDTADDSVLEEETGLDWTAITGKYGTYTYADVEFWVLPDADTSQIIIGSSYFPMQALSVDDGGTWSFGAFEFSEDLNNSPRIPFYVFNKGVTITPSGRTGSITVTASSSVFTAAHEGTYIRYANRVILLDTYNSGTSMDATVIDELPPTKDITVASVAGYKIGDAVDHDTLGGQGIVTGIAGSVVTVLITSRYDGFTNSGKLVAPDASQTISAIADASSLAATTFWDEQLLSPVHGYAGWGARHGGRVYLCQHPEVPSAYAASAAGLFDDFRQGAGDADGFVERIGSDRGGDLLYIVSAEDLLFLTTRGTYYHQTRDGSVITPTTINPVPFSSIGVAPVPPVTIDDGAVFIDSGGEQVHVCTLVGDVYRSWRVRNMSKVASHLISSPSRIGASTFGSERPESLILVVNDDGSLAVAQWESGAEEVAWRPWTTQGEFVQVYQSGGHFIALVDRTIDETAVRFREKFVDGVYMDAVAAVKVSTGNLQGQAGQPWFGGVTAFATHLDGHTASVYFEGWDYGDLVIDAAGKPLDSDGNNFDYQDYAGIVQVGLHFTVRCVPWARRSVRTQRGTRDVKRLVDFYVTVQATNLVEIDGTSFGGYRVGEALDEPPLPRSQEYRMAMPGDQSYRDIPISRGRPGPFRLMELKYRVTI
ncbi:MAG: hypothetical protein JXQ91_07720 [Vannielia sp.]|uniref:hypothetical protein n=1 Tax=Vannielia sp. TaxID=2813045 RepID=UPI003B8BCC76